MASQQDSPSGFRSARVLIIGLAATIAVLTLALVALTMGRSAVQEAVDSSGGDERINVLADSEDACVTCHANTTPGIVHQYGHSSMAAANVTCQDCHVVEADYPGATEHEGVHVLGEPTTAKCGTCHANEVAQFNQSRHGLPSYVAYNGTEGLSEEHIAMYEAIPEGGFAPDKMRNALFKLEGPEITKFACESCHNIGKPAADGSVGKCTSCHIRHEFSLEQAASPRPVMPAISAPIIPSGRYIKSQHTASPT